MLFAYQANFSKFLLQEKVFTTFFFSKSTISLLPKKYFFTTSN